MLIELLRNTVAYGKEVTYITGVNAIVNTLKKLSMSCLASILAVPCIAQPGPQVQEQTDLDSDRQKSQRF